MLCINLKGYQRTCGGVTGGISDAMIFDPNDLNFTQAPPISGKKQPYTAVALREDAEGPVVFPVNFQVDEGEWTVSQSRTGCAVSYEHEFILQLPETSQDLTDFLEAIDSAGCCCGVGLIVRFNSGKIFVAGEKYVNGATIPRFTLAQNGSEGGSGKLFSDFNGLNLHLQSTYSRSLYEFTGAWSVIEALAVSAGSGE